MTGNPKVTPPYKIPTRPHFLQVIPRPDRPSAVPPPEAKPKPKPGGGRP